MRHWHFRDYVDGAGQNQIRIWLDSEPLKVQMRIDALIRNLEVAERLWEPHVKVLKGECKGLIELRIKINKIQYRPLAYYGPIRRQITLLYGAIEKGDRFEPKNSCEIALERRALIESGFASTCPHEFD